MAAHARERSAWRGRRAPARRRARRSPRRPAPAMRQQALAPAHPRRHLLDQQAARTRPDRVAGAAVTLATAAPRGGAQRDRGQRRPHGLGGRRHQPAMERRADRQHHAARRRPCALASSTARSTARACAADHDLAGRVVVGDVADAGLAPPRRRSPRPSARSRPSSAAMAPSPTGTAACIAWPRSLQQARGVADREAAGRGQRRVLAERMAGDEPQSSASRAAAARLERAQRRERGRHQRRLGVLGQAQPLVRALRRSAG